MRQRYANQNGRMMSPVVPEERELDGTVMKRMKKLPRGERDA